MDTWNNGSAIISFHHISNSAFMMVSLWWSASNFLCIEAISSYNEMIQFEKRYKKILNSHSIAIEYLIIWVMCLSNGHSNPLKFKKYLMLFKQSYNRAFFEIGFTMAMKKNLMLICPRLRTLWSEMRSFKYKYFIQLWSYSKIFGLLL